MNKEGICCDGAPTGYQTDADNFKTYQYDPSQSESQTLVFEAEPGKAGKLRSPEKISEMYIN